MHGNRQFVKRVQLAEKPDCGDLLPVGWPYENMLVRAVQRNYYTNVCSVRLEEIRIGSSAQLQELLAGAVEHGWELPDFSPWLEDGQQEGLITGGGSVQEKEEDMP